MVADNVDCEYTVTMGVEVQLRAQVELKTSVAIKRKNSYFHKEAFVTFILVFAKVREGGHANNKSNMSNFKDQKKQLIYWELT